MNLTSIRNFWKELIRPFKWYQYLGLNFALGFGAGVVFAGGMFDSVENFFTNWIWSTILTLFLWTGNAGIVQYLSLRISWIERPWTRALSGVVIQSVYSVVIYMTVNVSLRFFLYHNVPENFWWWLINNSLFPILISIARKSVI